MHQRLSAAHYTSQAMRQIRCPSCGTINLEKFVTFPHCANCGTLLPAPEASSEAASQLSRAWQRPFRVLLWVAVLICATLALAAAAVFFQATPQEPGQVVIYGQLSRATQVGHLLGAQFTVDTMDVAAARPESMLNAVELRIPREFFDNFDFVALDPAPDEITDRGTARYFRYTALPRETRLQLSIRARQPGRHRLSTRIYADEYTAGEFRTAITVQPTARPKNRGK